MSSGKKILKVMGIVLGVLALLVGTGALWAKSAAKARLAQTFETHTVQMPVPLPLSKGEIAALRSSRAKKAAEAASEAEAEGVEKKDPAEVPSREGEAPAPEETPVEEPSKHPPEEGKVDEQKAPGQNAPGNKAPEKAAGDEAEGDEADENKAGGEQKKAPPADPLQGVNLDAIARSRAIARGRHLVEARYACVECHGKDFGGGTMMDAMPVARLFGPNLTAGEGSVTKDYKIADWDRIVRHGVLPDGKPAAMPSEDYFQMSDRELSDIITYIRSLPAVDRPSKPRELGPVGTVLMATNQIRLSAEHRNHQEKHPDAPPRTAPNAEFGEHLVAVCVGCHRPDLSGGPIVGGDPAWPPAKNITLHEQGIAGWTYNDFVASLREAKSKDGTALREPMSLLAPYAKKMTDTELQAMWAYLGTVPPRPTSK